MRHQIPVDFRDDRNDVIVEIGRARGSQVYPWIDDLIPADAWSSIQVSPTKYQDWCDATYFTNTQNRGFKPSSQKIVSLWNYFKAHPLDNSLTETVVYRKDEGKYEFMDGRHRAIVLCHLKAPIILLLVPTIQIAHFESLLS